MSTLLCKLWSMDCNKKKMAYLRHMNIRIGWLAMYAKINKLTTFLNPFAWFMLFTERIASGPCCSLQTKCLFPKDHPACQHKLLRSHCMITILASTMLRFPWAWHPFSDIVAPKFCFPNNLNLYPLKETNMESVKKKLDEAKSELSSQVANVQYWLYGLRLRSLSLSCCLMLALQAARFAAEMGKVAKARDAHHTYVEDVLKIQWQCSWLLFQITNVYQHDEGNEKTGRGWSCQGSRCGW